MLALGVSAMLLGSASIVPATSAVAARPGYDAGGWYGNGGWGWGGGYGRGSGYGYDNGYGSGQGDRGYGSGQSGSGQGDRGYGSGQSGSGEGGNGYGSGQSAGGQSGSGGAQSGGAASASADIERMIAYGLTYLGTPYEFGSDRDDDRTFDCSDFVRWIFKAKLDVALPTNSREQGDYVREIGPVETDWRHLERGDLMFFMEYNGPDAADYRQADAMKERITHVGVYLGDGRILQTYSKESGGVRIDAIAGSQWNNRFLFGGSALK